MAWLQLEVDATPLGRRRAPAVQLFAAWLAFVMTGAVYHLPATLLGSCPNSTPTQSCSVAEEFGLSSSAIGWLPGTFLLVKGFLALPVGVVLQRIRAKRSIVTGTVLLLGAGLCYTLAVSYLQLLLAYVLFAFAYSLAGLTPLIVFANSWFTARFKSTSIGLLVTGFSVAGVLWPPLVATVAEMYGWRVAAALLPATTLAIALPISVFILVDGNVAFNAAQPTATPTPTPTLTSPTTPTTSTEGRLCSSTHSSTLSSSGSPSGMRPPLPRLVTTCSAADSQQGQSVVASAATAGRSWPPWLMDPVFWHLMCFSFELLYVINAVTHLLVRFLTTEVKLQLSHAGWYSSLVFALSIVGKVTFGAALDSPHRRLAGLTCCTLVALGGALTLRIARGPDGGLTLEAADGHPQLLMFATCFGLGYGGCFTLSQSRAARLYGHTDSFSQLQSVLAVAQYLGSFCGVVVTSSLQERSGSFCGAFALFPLLGMAMCMHTLRMFPSRSPRSSPHGAREPCGEPGGLAGGA